MLAGGTSRRYGSDKLAALLDGVPLLHRAIAGLPAGWELILVGPKRPLPRPALFTAEDPPGGGPAAALVAGAVAGVRAGASVIVTVPGDAPAGGRAAVALIEALQHRQRTEAVLAVDSDGVQQPLQFAVTGATLARLASRTNTAGMSARALVADLGDVVRVELPPELTADIDVQADVDRLTGRRSESPRPGRAAAGRTANQDQGAP